MQLTVGLNKTDDYSRSNQQKSAAISRNQQQSTAINSNITMMMRRLAVVVIYYAATIVVTAEYLESPVVQWSHQIKDSGTLGGRSFRRSNGIVATSDQSTVFATADDGSLHIIKPADSSSSSVVVKAPVVEGSYAEGRSSVTLSETVDGVLQFAVYAVVLTPVTSSAADQSRNKLKSRIIAAHADGTIRWIVEVDGYVEGTPLVGVSGRDVYVPHNVPTSDDNFAGRVSVLRDVGDGTVAVAAEIIPNAQSAPFGPLTIQSGLVDGAERDFVFWSRSTDSPTFIYGLFPTARYTENDGMGVGSYNLKAFASWDRSSIAKPTVSSDLSGLWVGGSAVAGWTGAAGPINNVNQIAPGFLSWETELAQPEFDPSQPLFTSMVVSNDNRFIYLTDTSVNMICIDAATGDIQWSSDGAGNSGYSVEPQLSEMPGEIPVVYTIESMNGRLRQHNALTGNINWTFDCSDRTNQIGCQDGVEADFSVSPNGNLIYFGDIYGTVTAVQVAAFPTPSPTAMATEAPVTQAPVTASPVTAIPLTEAPVVVVVVPVTEAPVGVDVVPVTEAPVEVVVVPVTEAPVGVDIRLTTAPVASVPATVLPVFDLLVTTAPVAGIPETTAPAVAVGQPAEPTSSPVLGLPTSGRQVGSAVGGSDKKGTSSNRTLLFWLIAVFAGATIAAIVLFGMMIRRKRNYKLSEEAMVLKKKKDSERNWEAQQKQLEEDCRQQEMEILRGVGAVTPVPAPSPKTPKKSFKHNPRPAAVTPSTLASIEEFPDEDMSLAGSLVGTPARRPSGTSITTGYDLAQSISALTSLVGLSSPEQPAENSNENEIPTAEEKRDDESNAGGGYLPTALASTFEQVGHTFGFGTGSSDENDQKERSRSPIPYSGNANDPANPISPYTTGAVPNPYTSDRPWADLGGDLGDDNSSIGSDSMFTDDDGSQKTPRSQFLSSDDSSQPGLIPTKKSKAEEPGNDAWSSLMSTIIKAEENFFNPTAASAPPPPRTEPETGSVSGDDSVLDSGSDLLVGGTSELLLDEGEESILEEGEESILEEGEESILGEGEESILEEASESESTVPPAPKPVQEKERPFDETPFDEG